MSWLKWCLVGLVLTVVGAVATMPERVEAYDAPCHKHVTRQSDSLWTFPELHDYLYAVIEGSGCEDQIEHIYDWEGICGSTVRHFWDPELGDFQQNNCEGNIYNNAWVKGRALMDRAVGFYWAYVTSGSPATVDSAYHYLGHTVHLMTDMAAPCHIHIDWHPGGALDDAAYEDWMCCQHCDDNMNSPCLTSYVWQQAVARWGNFYVDGPTSAMAANYLGGECWEPRELQASFYYLMYTTNQVTDYFASDSYDGDTDVRPGWGVDYTGFPASPTLASEMTDNDDGDNNDGGDLSNIADFAYTKAMSSVAALYIAWRDYWDDILPTTYPTITGAPEVHDGWRPNQVTVHLAADDNSLGMAIHDSGVWDMTYWLAGGDTSVFQLDYLMIAVVDEGINQLYYQARDRFGNQEALKSQIIKIDKTAPEASIISPTHDGLYLTDGSFTIDFEASDVPSGLYSLVADLDGEPVSDGQVFDDLETEAGYHTVTVTAEDFAGNTTVVSVNFSIKIHASVYFQPEVLNTKSDGATMVAHVGFPPEYDVTQIDPPTATLTVEGTVVPAKPWPSTVGHKGPDGLPERILQFDRKPVCGALADVTDEVILTVCGRLVDSTEFYGTDTVEVFSPPLTGGNSAMSNPTEKQTAYDSNGSRGEALTAGKPTQLAIVSASPNPFNQHTTISFGLPREGRAELDLFDVSGHLVMSLIQGEYPAGYHTFDWYNGRNVGTGLYVLRLRLGSDTVTRKVVISK
ncbi:MAG: T9SS type A sorting domain-containing protein [Candidatus Eisenbacteria bacterium]